MGHNPAYYKGLIGKLKYGSSYQRGKAIGSLGAEIGLVFVGGKGIQISKETSLLRHKAHAGVNHAHFEAIFRSIIKKVKNKEYPLKVHLPGNGWKFWEWIGFFIK